MKRLPVEYGDSARDDVDSIFLYVLDESQSYPTAVHYTDRLYARCERIGDAPRGGASREDLGRGLRLVPFEDAGVILYRVESEAVWIVRIFLGGQDYDAIMRGEEQ